MRCRILSRCCAFALGWGKLLPPSVCTLTSNWEVFLVQTLLTASGQRECMCLLNGMATVLSRGSWQHWLPGIETGREGLTNGCAYLWVSFLPVTDNSFTFLMSWCGVCCFGGCSLFWNLSQSICSLLLATPVRNILTLCNVKR